MTVRVGFYGAGFISQIHRFLLATSGVDHAIVAVHDPDAMRAEAFAAPLAARAVGEDELLDLVDAVYVTTWTSEHPRLVEKIAARGLAVFCEKPLAVNAAIARQMIDRVREAGVVHQVGLILRALAPSRILTHLIRDERAGRVLSVVFRDDQFIPIQGHYASTWRSDPARCGRGALLEHSIHDLDLLQWWLGPVQSLSAVTREFHGYPRIDDLAVVRLEFKSGAVASLTSVWHDVLERPSMRRVEVFCERLHAVIEGDLAGPVRWQFTGEPERCLEGDELTQALAERGDEPRNPAAFFLEAVRDRGAAEPDFAQALAAHQLADAVYASADAGGRLVTDPYAPHVGG
jgi:predicted dehydrogenase